MRAKMKSNLILRYQLSELRGELSAVRRDYGWQSYFALKEFLKSVEGKTVDLVFVGSDAFEKIDNNYWLPESLWEAV